MSWKIYSQILKMELIREKIYNIRQKLKTNIA